MGFFTLHDDQGLHFHVGDDVTVRARETGDLLVTGPYNGFGWVEGDVPGFDVFSVTMMLEAKVDPLENRHDAQQWRDMFFRDYYGNEPKINKYLDFRGMTGLDDECTNCQSIPHVFA